LPVEHKYRMSNDIRKLINIVEAAQRQYNPAFLAWFRGSKVVDSSGSPLMVFRGTRRVPKSTGFGLRRGRATSSFAADPHVASVYARQLATHEYGAGSNVHPVYLAIKTPFDIRDLGENATLDEIFRKFPKYDIGTIIEILQELDTIIYNTGARYKIDASDGLYRMKDFVEVAEKISELAGDDDSSIVNILEDCTIDTFTIGDSSEFVAALESFGYDGIFHYDAFDVGGKLYGGDPDDLEMGNDGGPTHITYRPFYQTQIKSATGNIGTYDPQQDDMTKESK
jgi:hypothetical protein